jgi:putative ABC transport system permease protein
VVRTLKELRLSIRSLFRRRQEEQQLSEELQLHLERQIEQNLAAGMAPEEARYAALRLFGGVQQIQEECREARGITYIESLVQDLKYTLRTLRKNRGFTAVAVLTLSLGIGANAAIFLLLDAVRLRTLPVDDPQDLFEVRISNAVHGRSGNFSGRHPALTHPQWIEIREHRQAFSGVFAFANDSFNLAATGEVRNAQGLWVSGDFFKVLGVRPVLGRVLTLADDQPGCGLAGAVISYAFWQREFGGDASAIGKKLTLDYHPVEVIGITPASFYGPEVGRFFDVALPLCAEKDLKGEESRLNVRRDWWLTAMGRLKPGWAPEHATAQLASISPGVFTATVPPGYDAKHAKDYLGFKLGAFPAGTGVSELRKDYTDPLWLLLGLTSLVLLIACVNLANLILARASARERELAVRLALGAWRGRLIRQLMAESVLLASLGAGLGLFVARALSQFLVSFLSTQRSSIFLNVDPDWRVLAFTTGIAILACLLFGMAPALRATGIAPAEAMKTGNRGLAPSGREGFGLRRALVVSQVALSLVLVVGALLFSRSLRNLLTLDAGFRQNGVLIASLDLGRLNLSVERRQAFKRDLLERLRATAGVESAAETGIIPASGDYWNDNVWADGSDSKHEVTGWFDSISSGLFRTLGTPLVAGRDFDDRDTQASTKVAIVNQTFIRKLGLGPNPVGKRFWREVFDKVREPDQMYEIVGLVTDMKYGDLHEDFLPVAYFPASQNPHPDLSDQILIRSHIPLMSLTSEVKRTISTVSPDITIDFQAFESMIRDSLLRDRLMATLSGFFGLLAVVLAVVGLYGVMSYMVARRTNEIGIRIALGAHRSAVVKMILREAAMLVAAGFLVGTVAALAGGRAAGSLLFGLQPYDPLTLVMAMGLLATVALAAAYLPASRASRVDPIVALRNE